MNPSRRPILLARRLGAGTVVFAQLGTWTAYAHDAIKTMPSASPLAALVRNLLGLVEAQPR